MEIFVDRDREYAAWVERTPQEFVLNTYRRPSRSYLKLHRATCRTITTLQPGASRWTSGEYSKICGTRAEVEEWAARELQASVEPCPLCL